MPKNKRNQGNEKLTNSESSGRCCWSLAPASRKARTFSQRIQGAKVVGESCAGSNQQKAFAHLSSPSLLLLLHLSAYSYLLPMAWPPSISSGGARNRTNAGFVALLELRKRFANSKNLRPLLTTL